VSTRPVVVVTGARQTGKTSTLRRLFPDHRFVSLDLPSEAEQAEKEPVALLQRHPQPVILDEVQYAPGLLRHLKMAVDANRRRMGQFLLTGSQSVLLARSHPGGGFCRGIGRAPGVAGGKMDGTARTG
jgi:predicted AAA+ superfamily ATPase